MSLLTLENFSFSQWDEYGEFLDQSSLVDENEANSWLEGNMNQIISSHENGGRIMQNAMSGVDGASSSTTRSSPVKDSEPSSNSPTPERVRTGAQNSRKRPKGRPKLDLNDGQSATERRRTQVRLAQQAYRHRKEATVISLKKENDDLKNRLNAVLRSFDQLLGISMRSRLPVVDLDRIHYLCKTVEEFRILPVSTEEKNDSNANMESRNMLVAVTRTAQDDEVNSPPIDEITGPKRPSRSPHFQESTNIFRVAQKHSTYSLKMPSVSPFEPLPSAPIPFALRFRHEALKRGYQIITSQEASSSLLCRAFKYCIFSETREGIIKRIQNHLYQSSKFVYQTMVTGSCDRAASTDPCSKEPFIDLETSEAAVESGDRFLDAEEVERYLLDRGLQIQTEGNVVFLPASTGHSHTTSPTLFDELRGGQKLEMSVSKLLSELLDRIVCLDLGPGIQALEIDAAIRSTVIASL